jgi:hypothetical protein
LESPTHSDLCGSVSVLVLLGSDVEIVVKPRDRATGQARVLVA